MSRMMADCRRFPSEMDCSLTIIGDEDEVVLAATEHAVSVHGHEDTSELRDMIRQGLEPDSLYASVRQPEASFPG